MKKHINSLATLALASLTTLITACGTTNSYQYAPPVGQYPSTIQNGSYNTPGAGYNNNLGSLNPNPNYMDPSLNSNLPTGTIMGKVVDSLSK